MRDYRKRDETTPDEKYLYYRVRILPSQLQRARARLAELEAEAARLGFTDLLEKRA